MSFIESRKPVWAEGVLLGQQHFQVYDSYNEQQHAKRQSYFQSFAYGFESISLDMPALSRGIVNVLNTAFVLKNGRLIEYSRQQTNELKLEIPSDRTSVTIFIGIASNNSVGEIEGYGNNGQLTAYKAEYIEVADLHDPSRSREVLVSNPNLVLLTDQDQKSYFDTLPLVRLIRGDDGDFVIDDAFIPPLLNINSSKYLQQLLNRTCNLVNAKANVLLNRRQSFGSVTDFGPNELNSFLLLSSLLPGAKQLEHIKSLALVHPERLYCELLNLLSRISIFEHSELMSNIPQYQHDNLSDVFASFDLIFNQMLEGVVPKRMSGLKLERLSDSIYQVQTIDSSMFERNDFYLAVFIESSDSKWIETFPEQVKIGSAENLELIVSSALNGVQLTHCQRPPNKLAVKSGYEYFRIESYGDFWHQIVEEQSMGVFIPFSMQSASIELVTVDKH
ncbi:type VI secretion system baseplate subunit TssK [Flocculibacter collagenilyticus]|uniref:type VI secretion system baseplate subunit TssK n=1 Tax=Flocculibacter collagenilyticus TaxID=2744479 RepID=UPI0018F75DEB|nr:type VI secretion system baseplate subunit TssK [Flocculibacter collagenilyticus]